MVKQTIADFGFRHKAEDVRVGSLDMSELKPGNIDVSKIGWLFLLDLFPEGIDRSGPADFKEKIASCGWPMIRRLSLISFVRLSLKVSNLMITRYLH